MASEPEKLNGVSPVATIPELTTNPPVAPAVCESKVRVDSPSVVTTLAVTPMLAALMALARPAIELTPLPA